MISVIMSCYNSEDFLAEAVESVLNQSFMDFEFIIVDDASTDNTLDILQKYATLDSRIRILHNSENIGLTRSLNRAIQNCKGELIARMDSDDISHPERFAKQVHYLNRYPNVVVLGTSGINIDDHGNILGKRSVPLTNREVIATILTVCPLIHPSVMFRRREICEIGMYNPEFRLSQDYELWFRCVKHGYEIENLVEALISYRINSSFFSRKSFHDRLIEYKVRKKGYDYLSVPLRKRYALLIPLVLAVIPPFAMKRLYRYFKVFDPRERRYRTNNS